MTTVNITCVIRIINYTCVRFQMLLALGVDGRSVYEEEFEVPFLKIIVEDFKRETRDQYFKLFLP